MLNQLLKFTLISGFLLWLRRRWKWLVGCGAVIALAMYLHSEFLAYVAALPPGSDRAAAASEYISAAFFAKNLMIFGALLTYFVVEMRASRRHGATRRRAASGAGSTRNDSTVGEVAPADSDGADDGFDFLRHGQRLESRADKVLGTKRGD